MERTVGAALRGRPARDSISATRQAAQKGIRRRAATEDRPYSTYRVAKLIDKCAVPEF
jgi:hypothetical protein